MQRKRDLFVTNLLAILILIGVLLAGWWDAAAFGLGVLLFMDLLVVVRQAVGQASHRATMRSRARAPGSQRTGSMADEEQSARRGDQR